MCSICVCVCSTPSSHGPVGNNKNIISQIRNPYVLAERPQAPARRVQLLHFHHIAGILQPRGLRLTFFEDRIVNVTRAEGDVEGVVGVDAVEDGGGGFEGGIEFRGVDRRVGGAGRQDVSPERRER